MAEYYPTALIIKGLQVPIRKIVMSKSPQAIDSQQTAASIAKLTIQMDALTITYEEQSRVVNSCQVSPTHRRNKYISGKHHAQQDIQVTVLTSTQTTRESHNESPVVTSGNHNNNINSFLVNNSSMKLKEPPAIIKGGESDFSKSYWLARSSYWLKCKKYNHFNDICINHFHKNLGKFQQ